MSNQPLKTGALVLCIANCFFLSSPLQASFWVNDQENQQLLLDTAYLSTVLQPSHASLAAYKQTHEHIIDLILPNKDSISVKATPNTLIPSALAQRYPTLGSWDIVAVDDPSISGVMDMSEQGMHALLFMPNGELVVIDPDTSALAAKNSIYSSHLQPYTSHYKQRNKHTPIQCKTQGHDHSKDILPQSSLAYKAADSLITYRLALAATSQ